MTGGRMSPDEMVEYMARVELVEAGMNRLGRGAQQNAAFDIRVSPSLVSQIMRGRYIDPDKLTELEAWLEGKLQEMIHPPDLAEAEA